MITVRASASVWHDTQAICLVWTSRQFWDRVSCYAAVLRDEYAVRSGDRVLGCIEKSVDTVSSFKDARSIIVALQVALYMAVMQLGALYISVHHETRSLDHYVSDSNPRVIVIEGDRAVGATAVYSSSSCMVADKASIYRLVSRVVNVSVNRAFTNFVCTRNNRTTLLIVANRRH